MSDYEYFRIKHISISSFHYNIKRLSMAAYSDATAIDRVHEKQESLPIHCKELKDNNCIIPRYFNNKSDIK